jgi:hypothetical protein
LFSFEKTRPGVRVPAASIFAYLTQSLFKASLQFKCKGTFPLLFFFSHFVVLLFSNFGIEDGWLIGLVFRIDIYIPVLFPEGWKVLDYPACIV